MESMADEFTVPGALRRTCPVRLAHLRYHEFGVGAGESLFRNEGSNPK